MNDKVYSVGQINELIRNIIDNEAILENINVEGELSSFSITRNIAYFNLKDDNNLLSCVLFNADKYADYKVGDFVKLYGSIKYYAKGGRLSFNATRMEQAGQGRLYKQFLELKAKLENEGLFDNAFKKPIPSNINKIAVITSKSGAVLQDIFNVTSRRNPMLNIMLYDVQVQGQYAKSQIVDALHYLSGYKDIDVIIVARGGGSLEDLQPFNEEEVARACFDCETPVISAVGHETDFTIIDFVADLRAPTPSAAAELVTKDLSSVRIGLKQKCILMSGYINTYIQTQDQRIKSGMLRLEKHTITNVQDSTLRLISLETKINAHIDKTIDNAIYSVNMKLNTLDKLNPTNVLRKGYSILTSSNNVVKSIRDVHVNDDIDVTLLDGNVSAKVVNIKEKL